MSYTYTGYQLRQADYHPWQPVYQPPHHPIRALDQQPPHPQDGRLHQQHHPYQARQPTPWDPPWLRQETTYQQPSSYEPDLYSPPPPSCWDPPWLCTQQGYSPYDQPLPLDPNSRWNQPCMTHDTAALPHTFDSGYSTRQPTSGQPCPATTTANPILTQLQQLLEACYRMESRLDAADRRIDDMLPPELPEPAQPYGSQTFGSGDLVQHLPPSGNSKASLGPSGLVPYDSLAPLQQSSTTPLPFALLPDTALEQQPPPPPYAASQNTRSKLLPWQVEYRLSAYALSKTSAGDVLECNKKEILILDCDRVEEGFDDSSEKILHSSSRFCGVEKVDIDGNLEAHEDDVARELKSVEEKKSLFIVKDKFVHMCVEEDEATPDHGVLTPMKNWLKLLPDGSLPCINVCAAILRIFFDLPISLDQFGQREQLKKNDLGKDIMVLSKPDEMTRSNQKSAQDLVNKWSHLVFNNSPPSVYFYGNNEGRPSTIRYAFDPGGDSSPKLLFVSFFIVSWFPP